MKLPIIPVLLVLIVVVIGGVAFLKSASSPSEDSEAGEGIELDGDGDRDGDPTEVSGTGESVESSETTEAPEPTTPTTPAPTPAAPKPSGYTMAEVQAHASASSCWTVVEGNVYDLTSWINQHPGGKSAILRMCGKDGTQDFMDQHGGQGRPERELASFKIGALI